MSTNTSSRAGGTPRSSTHVPSSHHYSPASSQDFTHNSSPNRQRTSQPQSSELSGYYSYTTKHPGKKRRHMRTVRRHHKPLSLRAHIVAVYVGVVTVILVLFVVAQQVSIRDDASEAAPAYQVRSLESVQSARWRPHGSVKEGHSKLPVPRKRQIRNVTSTTSEALNGAPSTTLSAETSPSDAATRVLQTTQSNNFATDTTQQSDRISTATTQSNTAEQQIAQHRSASATDNTAENPSKVNSVATTHLDILSQTPAVMESASTTSQPQQQESPVSSLSNSMSETVTLSAISSEKTRIISPENTYTMNIQKSGTTNSVASSSLDSLLVHVPSSTPTSTNSVFSAATAPVSVTETGPQNIIALSYSSMSSDIGTLVSTTVSSSVAQGSDMQYIAVESASTSLVFVDPSSYMQPFINSENPTAIVAQGVQTAFTIESGSTSALGIQSSTVAEGADTTSATAEAYDSEIAPAAVPVPSLVSSVLVDSATLAGTSTTSVTLQQDGIVATSTTQITRQSATATQDEASENTENTLVAAITQTRTNSGVSAIQTSSANDKALSSAPKMTNASPSNTQFTSATKTPQSAIKEILTASEMLVTRTELYTQPGFMTTFMATESPITSTVTDGSNNVHVFTTTPVVLVTSSVGPVVVTRTAVYTVFPESTRAASSTNSGPIPADMPEFTISKTNNFLGHFLAPMLATALLVCSMTLDQNAKMYQPFALLARRGGACAEDSLTLKFYGLHAFTTPFRLLRQGIPLTALTTMLMWISWILIAVSAEAVHLVSISPCKEGDELCGVKLSFRPTASYLVVALVGLILLLLVALVFVLWKWDSGVCANPWSIAGIAALLSNRITREPLIGLSKVTHQNEIDAAYQGKEYELNLFQGRGGLLEYGIIPGESTAALRPTNDTDADLPSSFPDSKKQETFIEMVKSAVAKDKRQPFFALSVRARLLFILYLVLLVVWIGYYTQLEDAKHKMVIFMNSGEFGPKFLLAMFGVVVAVAWTHVYRSIAILGPFLVMKSAPQEAETSILITRTSNAYLGLLVSIRRKQLLTMVAASLSIIADFLPLIMCNIPQRSGSPIMRSTHNVCSAISLALLVFMIAMLLLSLVVRMPCMPGDPRTIAGAGVYISDSRLISEIKQCQTSMVDSRQREAEITDLGRRYVMDDMMGVSGAERYGVEVSSAVYQSKDQARGSYRAP
ncbi:uncharacterized protein BROUX77_001086 [Berkeleyomyces rouxiae]|uniref:uncharacterized protein n=1 Tax=Berkeleyomyces rouxiae TaxID=2035830 RepID=UPI003B8041F3